MESSHSEAYRQAGVDITAGYESVQRIKAHVARTKIPGVLGGLGGFGGLFAPDLKGMEQPVLVSGGDGVGTKLKLAFMLDKHDTIGIDCVAMCVNDILCSGAKPLFFLDYIGCGKNFPKKIEAIVSGVAEGCVQAQCALIGGETAEMPGFYPEDEYDLAGFAVGMVDQKQILDGSRVQKGDVVVALASSGVHSNGFSLLRSIFKIDEQPEVLQKYKDELGLTLGETLLSPTKIYIQPVFKLFEKVDVKCLCHITGGGLIENIPRMLPKGFTAKIDKKSIITPPVFDLIAKIGDISPRDMMNTFNMGIGMCLVVPAKDLQTTLEILKENHEPGYVIGEIILGEEGILL